jgi:hypothetical protein
MTKSISHSSRRLSGLIRSSSGFGRPLALRPLRIDKDHSFECCNLKKLNLTCRYQKRRQISYPYSIFFFLRKRLNLRFLLCRVENLPPLPPSTVLSEIKTVASRRRQMKIYLRQPPPTSAKSGDRQDMEVQRPSRYLRQPPPYLRLASAVMLNIAGFRMNQRSHFDLRENEAGLGPCRESDPRRRQGKCLVKAWPVGFGLKGGRGIRKSWLK